MPVQNIDNLCYMVLKPNDEYLKNGLDINLANTEHLARQKEIRNLKLDNGT